MEGKWKKVLRERRRRRKELGKKNGTKCSHLRRDTGEGSKRLERGNRIGNRLSLKTEFPHETKRDLGAGKESVSAGRSV